VDDNFMNIVANCLNAITWLYFDDET